MAYLAYKGFDKDLKCRGFQFAIGETFTKEKRDRLKICSSDGFHYCDSLKDVFDHYPNSPDNRFCEIEVLGEFEKLHDKAITTSFRIVKEIPKSEIDALSYEANINLKQIREIQERFPLVHVCGSAGLYLHGVKLKRLLTQPTSDIDLVAPFYVPLDSELKIDQRDDKRKSGSDFDYAFSMNGIKVDLRIDPKQRYEVIEYKGFKYKVSSFWATVEAKMRYAVGGNRKHKDDMEEIMHYKKETKTTDDDIPY